MACRHCGTWGLYQHQHLQRTQVLVSYAGPQLRAHHRELQVLSARGWRHTKPCSRTLWCPTRPFVRLTLSTEPKTKARFTIASSQQEYKLLASVSGEQFVTFHAKLKHAAAQSGTCTDRFDACTRQSSYHMCNENPGYISANHS